MPIKVLFGKCFLENVLESKTEAILSKISNTLIAENEEENCNFSNATHFAKSIQNMQFVFPLKILQAIFKLLVHLFGSLPADFLRTSPMVTLALIQNGISKLSFSQILLFSPHLSMLLFNSVVQQQLKCERI